jgi:hypothetical protein
MKLILKVTIISQCKLDIKICSKLLLQLSSENLEIFAYQQILEPQKPCNQIQWRIVFGKSTSRCSPAHFDHSTAFWLTCKWNNVVMAKCEQIRISRCSSIPEIQAGVAQANITTNLI